MKDVKAALIIAAVFAVMFLGMCMLGSIHEGGTDHSAQRLETASFDLRSGGEYLLKSGVEDAWIDHRFTLTEQSGICELTILSDIETRRSIDGFHTDCFGEMRMDGISVLSGGGMEVYQSEICGGITVQTGHDPGTRYGSGFTAEFLGNGSDGNDACSRFCFRMFDSECCLRMKVLLQYGDEETKNSIAQNINIRILA